MSGRRLTSTRPTNDQSCKRGNLVKRIIAVLIVLGVGIVAVAMHLTRSLPRVEHVGLLSREISPWCSKYGLIHQVIVRSHVDGAQLGVNVPAWTTSGVNAAALCSRGPGTGLTLDLLTFSSAGDENLWLLNDTTTPFAVAGSATPNAVYIGDGWIANLGWNERLTNVPEGQALASLGSVLHAQARFTNFGSVSW